MASETEHDWAASRTWCQALDPLADLVQIKTAAENELLKGLCNSRLCWLGLVEAPDTGNKWTKQELQTWHWEDGTAIGSTAADGTYSNWKQRSGGGGSRTEPNNGKWKNGKTKKDERNAFMNYPGDPDGTGTEGFWYDGLPELNGVALCEKAAVNAAGEPITPAPTPAPPSAMWKVDAGHCTVEASSGCLYSPNYPSNYPDYDECKIEVLQERLIQVELFNVEHYYDYLEIDNKVYTGDTQPQEVLAKGMITWVSDVSNPGKWKLCPGTAGTASHDPVPVPPTPDPNGVIQFEVLGGSSECNVDAKGCATSPNYPTKYSNKEFCKLNVTVSGPYQVEWFDTEDWHDELKISGRDYSGLDEPKGDALAVGTEITWTSDYSIRSGNGWKLCPVAPAAPAGVTAGGHFDVNPAGAPAGGPPRPGSGPAHAFETVPATAESVLTWHVESGDCAIDDTTKCLTSPNFPQMYCAFRGKCGTWRNPGFQCKIGITAPGKIDVEAFSTEATDDYLFIDGTHYSGEVGPEDVEIASPSAIDFVSDRWYGANGFKLCPGGAGDEVRRRRTQPVEGTHRRRRTRRRRTRRRGSSLAQRTDAAQEISKANKTREQSPFDASLLMGVEEEYTQSPFDTSALIEVNAKGKMQDHSMPLSLIEMDPRNKAFRKEIRAKLIRKQQASVAKMQSRKAEKGKQRKSSEKVSTQNFREQSAFDPAALLSLAV